MEQTYFGNIQKGVDAAIDYGVSKGLDRETAQRLTKRMMEDITQAIVIDMNNLADNSNIADPYANTNVAINNIANAISFYGIDKNIAQNMAQMIADAMANAMIQFTQQMQQINNYYNS